MVCTSGWLFLFQQLLGSLLLLAALGRQMRQVRRVGSLAAAASFDALLSLLCVLRTPGLFRLFACLFAAVSPLLAFPGMPRALRPGAAGIALLLSPAASGLCRLFHGLGFPPGVAALSPLLLPGLLLLPGRAAQAECAVLTIRCGCTRCTIAAMVDSGNLARDPLLQLPVIVCTRNALAPLAHACAVPVRMLPVRTVAGMGLMPIFRADEVLLDGRPVQALLGIAPGNVSDCPALVPACLAHPSHSDKGG